MAGTLVAIFAAVIMFGSGRKMEFEAVVTWYFEGGRGLGCWGRRLDVGLILY